MTNNTQHSEEEAKEIVGKWGYEEEYWWKPIAKAIQSAREEGIQEGLKSVFDVTNEAFNQELLDKNSELVYAIKKEAREEALKEIFNNLPKVIEPPKEIDEAYPQSAFKAGQINMLMRLNELFTQLKQDK